jgi:hypothetical protein
MEEQDLKEWRVELASEKRALDHLPDSDERSIRLRAWADSTAAMNAAWQVYNRKGTNISFHVAIAVNMCWSRSVLGCAVLRSEVLQAHY